jgi:hypothetical protein
VRTCEPRVETPFSAPPFGRLARAPCALYHRLRGRLVPASANPAQRSDRTVAAIGCANRLDANARGRCAECVVIALAVTGNERNADANAEPSRSENRADRR